MVHIYIKYSILSKITNIFELNTKFWTIYIILKHIYNMMNLLENFNNFQHLNISVQKMLGKFFFSLAKISLVMYPYDFFHHIMNIRQMKKIFTWDNSSCIKILCWFQIWQLKFIFTNLQLIKSKILVQIS